MSLEVLKTEVKHLTTQISKLEELLENQRTDRKGVYERLRTIEQNQTTLPSSEEVRAILNMIEAQKLKRDFWRKMLNTLVTRGVIAATGVACINYWDVITTYVTHLGKG